ncbi:MAG: hypothetical protein JW841_01650 [Deltaproteobacteria bacterium]|nr:hypothetical protein [Deltaproteobacteria bacterium]
MKAQANSKPPNRLGQKSVFLRCDLAALDALEVESVGAFCWSDVAPLVGPVGYIDWRLCGALSRTIEKRQFEADLFEVMLTPVSSRLTVHRLFVFGLGQTSEVSTTNIRKACRKAYEVMTLAGVKRMVFAVPSAREKPELEEQFINALEAELPGLIELVLTEYEL